MQYLSIYSLICMACLFGLWLANELFVEFQQQTKSSTISKQAKQNDTWLFTGTVSCYLVFSLFLILNWNGNNAGVIPIPILSYVGSAIALVGVGLRRYAIHTLKDNFDVLIQVKETQQLKTNGLYTFVRHPSYTGSILFFMGFGLSSLNVFTFVLFTVFIVTIYRLRIRIEEEVLIDGFSNQYIEYRKQTSPFFPNFKTIKKQLGVKRHVQRSNDKV